jgi:transposase
VRSSPGPSQRRSHLRSFFSSSSKASVRRSPQSFTSRASSEASAIAARLAAYAGLAPTPWRSGTIDQEQGISKAGNPRLRRTMIEFAWLWQRHQPASALSRWFHTRLGRERGRIRRISIVALARKLLIAVWRYVTQGEVPEGAVLKAA